MLGRVERREDGIQRFGIHRHVAGGGGESGIDASRPWLAEMIGCNSVTPLPVKCLIDECIDGSFVGSP